MYRGIVLDQWYRDSGHEDGVDKKENEYLVGRRLTRTGPVSLTAGRATGVLEFDLLQQRASEPPWPTI